MYLSPAGTLRSSSRSPGLVDPEKTRGWSTPRSSARLTALLSSEPRAHCPCSSSNRLHSPGSRCLRLHQSLSDASHAPRPYVSSLRPDVFSPPPNEPPLPRALFSLPLSVLSLPLPTLSRFSACSLRAAQDSVQTPLPPSPIVAQTE